MFLDNFERFGVTADCKKVLPGMIYVDLQENKSRKEIYNAFQNGASVIFTSQNISDPELPVIKVNNVYETMLLLLNNHFNSPQNRVKLVAVSGSYDKDIVLDLLYRMLADKSQTLGSDVSGSFAEYFNALKNMSIEDMYEHISKVASSGEHFMPIIVDYKLKYFRFINSFSFDCALITGVNSVDVGDQSYVLGSIRSFVSQIPDSKPIIVNNDDDMVLKALEASKNTILITYGLNKRAAVTATSIDVNEQTTFNYCLQRSLVTNGGNLLEPFEMPITLNLLGSRNIYNALAVITGALYYDVDIEHIKRTLLNYTPPRRRFEISKTKDIVMLDNYCTSAGDLDKTLEGIQMLDYGKLRLLLSINKNLENYEIEGIAGVLTQWSSVLGISEVVLCGCLDMDEQAAPIGITAVRKLKRAFGGLFVTKYFDRLQEAIEYTVQKSSPGDMLILSGGEEMNNAKTMAERQLNMESISRPLH